MAKLKEHISQLRSLIKQYSDDTVFTDPQLYKLLIDAISIMNERDTAKFVKLNDWNFKTFCVELCRDVSHNCECVKVGCNILKTVYEIPSPVTGRNRNILRVLTLDGREIPLVTEEEVVFRKYDPIFNGKLMYSVVNGYLIIWNANTDHIVPRAIQVRAIWEDISEWDGKQLCPPTGPECFDIYEEELPVERKYHFMIYSEILKLLGIQLQMKDDITNDASEKIKE